jgi:hypothetical protein
MRFNKPSANCQGTLTLKPLTVGTEFVGIMDKPIRNKNDCEQSNLYFRVVRKMGVLHLPCKEKNFVNGISIQIS